MARSGLHRGQDTRRVGVCEITRRTGVYVRLMPTETTCQTVAKHVISLTIRAN